MHISMITLIHCNYIIIITSKLLKKSILTFFLTFLTFRKVKKADEINEEVFYSSSSSLCKLRNLERAEKMAL